MGDELGRAENASARRTLTLPGKTKGNTPKRPREPTPPTAAPAAKPPGPAVSPRKPPAPYMPVFWMVMRDNGQRPKARHATLEAAQEEARRIAANAPGRDVWIIAAQTIETIRAEETTTP